MENKSDNIFVSVVTITFNNYDELETTLKSLKDASNYQSTVINGGKCQKTKNFLIEQKINHISEPDEGISDAFNKGIEKSNADFVTYLNSGDVLIDNDYYHYAVEYFKNNPQIDFIYADILFDHVKYGKIVVKPNQETGKTPFPHPSLIVRRSVFDKIGGFDKSLKVAMDFDFMYKIVSAKLQGHYYSKGPVVLMDGHGASSSNGIRGVKERYKILNKHGLLSFETKFYLQSLIAKTHARNLLDKAHLLDAYDKFKKTFFKIKSE